MATLDITEYNNLARDGYGSVIQAGREPHAAHQQLTIGGGSVQSAEFRSDTQLVRLHTDAACRIEISASPTAAATSQRLPANATEYFGVIGGHKIAVITTT